MLAYNCSPSFNWAAKLSVPEMETFREELAKMGYKFQFITLAGFHALNTAMFESVSYTHLDVYKRQEEASGSLTDFGIYFFRNAKQLLENGTRPYFYLPKLEHYKEARWWNEVFVFAQNYLQIPQGTIKATVLIETITASFQLDEILFELKEHSKGLKMCIRDSLKMGFSVRWKSPDSSTRNPYNAKFVHPSVSHSPLNESGFSPPPIFGNNAHW